MADTFTRPLDGLLERALLREPLLVDLSTLEEDPPRKKKNQRSKAARLRKLIQHTCERKQRYATRIYAQAMCKYLNDIYNDDMNAYPCPYCQGWHIGHNRLKKEESDASAQDQL